MSNLFSQWGFFFIQLFYVSIQFEFGGRVHSIEPSHEYLMKLSTGPWITFSLYWMKAKDQTDFISFHFCDSISQTLKLKLMKPKLTNKSDCSLSEGWWYWCSTVFMCKSDLLHSNAILLIIMLMLLTAFFNNPQKNVLVFLITR